MKICFSLALLFILPNINAQSSFENTVQLIQNKVSCCSVPFSPSTKRKVSNIIIGKTGNISLYYSDKKPKETFNLFDLYKEESITGVDTVMGGKFIQFHISAEKIRMIRFASVQDAKQAYVAFLKLFSLCENKSSDISSLNHRQTIQFINERLSNWAEPVKKIRMDAKLNGDMVISNNSQQTFNFNFFDLKNGSEQKESGIEILGCDQKAHAPRAWINFNTTSRQVAFIRLDCNIPQSELEIIRSAILHLGSLSQKPELRNSNNDPGVYFLTRTSTIPYEKEILNKSLRPVDKMDIADSTITISSKGEGWLDKDSLPTGKWNFYAKNKEGKEFLFKTGIFQRTNSGLFQVFNIDSADLKKDYHLTFYDLQRDQVNTIRFIKKSTWNYYHENGRLWKKVNYKANQIPIITVISESGIEGDASTQLLIQLKEEADEWIEGELVEFNSKGQHFKKLVYSSTGEVYKKTLYDTKGNILKEEIAKRYEKPVSATNY